MKRTFALCALIAGLSAPAWADDPKTPKLLPIEAACVTYAVEGQMQSGSLIRCHRDFGYEQYEIRDLKIGMGAFSQTQKQTVITIGDTIYTIDPSSNTGTKMKNPMYDRMVSGLAKSSPAKIGADFLAAMGYTATGAKKTVAGAECSVYTSATLGSACFTAGGLMLEQLVMGNAQTALKVAIGDAGGDATYDLPKHVKVSESPAVNIPSLKDLLRPQGR